MIEERTHQQILEIMLQNLSNMEDKSPNSFSYDILSAAGVIFEEGQRQLIELEKMFDVENLSGDDLTKRVRQINGTIRKPATHATGLVQITGEPGTLIPELTAFFAGEKLFYSLDEVIIDESGQVTVEVEADQPGLYGDILPGTISKTEPKIEGITEITNREAFTNGYIEETDAELLERYYERNLNPPKGGNPAHYKLWASEYPGIWDAKVFREWEGPGSGQVRVVVVSQEHTEVDERDLERVKAHILQEAPIRDEKLVVESAKNRGIDISLKVKLPSGVDLDLVKEAIESAIEDYFYSITFRQDFVSYAKVGKAVIDIKEILDYEGLTLDGVSDNAALKEEEIPVIGTLEVKSIE